METYWLAQRPQRLLRFSALIICLFGVFALRTPSTAEAHPLGNFSLNRYSRLELGASRLRLTYILDIAEIPTFQARPQLDTNSDELISQEEIDSYLARLANEISPQLDLRVNGRALPLTLQASQLQFLEGQGGLDTTRIEFDFTAPVPSADTLSLSYTDNNFSDRVGWREIVVVPTAAKLLDTAPTADISQQLRHYPTDLLFNPPTITQIQFRYQPSSGQVMEDGSATVQAAVDSASRFSTDSFGDLLSADTSTPLFVVIALITAFGLGAFHALSPGHGKTIVGAYLVGSRGTAAQALFLGLTTTITHTVGVFLFGLLVLFASRYILPEQLYPWLGVFSGLLVIGLGVSLLWGRWQGLHDKHDHKSEEGLHTHFGIAHSHTPPTNTSGRVSWRSLLALGVSGGLIPCPSALVLLLSAIALQRIGFGLVLIAVFSLGLASVLTLIGLVFVYAGRFFERFSLGNGRLAPLLPLASAAFITLAGAAITWRAFMQIGVI